MNETSYLQMIPNSDEGTNWIKSSSTTSQKVCPVIVMQNPNIICTFTLKQEKKRKESISIINMFSPFWFLFFLALESSCFTINLCWAKEARGVEEKRTRTWRRKWGYWNTFWLAVMCKLHFIMRVYHFSCILVYNWGMKKALFRNFFKCKNSHGNMFH